jgi:hypothetical protein
MSRADDIRCRLAEIKDELGELDAGNFEGTDNASEEYDSLLVEKMDLEMELEELED